MRSTTGTPRQGIATRVAAHAVRRVKGLLMRRLLVPTWRLEDELAARPGGVHADDSSPRRIEIVAESMQVEGLHRPMPGFPRSLPQVLSSARNIRASLIEVDDNPAQPRTSMTDADRAALERFIVSTAADTFGYATVPSSLVFKGKAILHPHAIVLAMEMDKERMDTAPSPDSAVMVHETYNQLGIAANEIARHLRGLGYSAQAGHPLGGLALYPPLAQAAGLGWQGMHGLLITPEFGPRVRLAAVFTSIENLPATDSDAHAWIEDFCRECVKCVRQCPPQAISSEPVRHESGRVTWIDADRCLPFFVRHNGCSLCIAVCPFHQRDYSWLQERWARHGQRSAELRADPPQNFPEHLRRPPMS